MVEVNLRERFEDQIQMLKDKFEEYTADGEFTVKEIIKFIVMCIFTLAKAIELIDVPGEQKKRFVVEVVTEIYMSEEVDIPWIMEPFETMLEMLVLDNVVPAVVDIFVEAVRREF